MYTAPVSDYTHFVMDLQSPERHERGPRGNSLVYPALSRRAGGISIGINLFPERKACSFDCPYCEVLPFPAGEAFSLQALAEDLDELLGSLQITPASKSSIKDLCFSGNGEPTLSPYLPEALDLAAAARAKFGLDPVSVPVRIITNSTGFLNQEIASCLSAFHAREGLSVWAKLDAGTQEWFRTVSGSGFDLDTLSAAIADFSRQVPVTIQTMLCSIDGVRPDLVEARSYALRIKAMRSAGARMEQLHFYTVARKPIDSRVKPIADASILEFMREVSNSLDFSIPMYGFGAASGLPLSLV